MLYDSIYTTFLKAHNCSDGELISGYHLLGVEEGVTTQG